MSSVPPSEADIRRWILLTLDGEIAPEQFRQLEEELQTNPAYLAFYVKELQLYESIAWNLQPDKPRWQPDAPPPLAILRPDDDLDDSGLSSLAWDLVKSPALPTAPTVQSRPTVDLYTLGTQLVGNSRVRSISLVAGVYYCLIMALFWGIRGPGDPEFRVVQQPDQPISLTDPPAPAQKPAPEQAPPSTAVVTRLANVEWHPNDRPPTVGTQLEVGDVVSPLAGNLQITFGSGATVDLHGPGKFEITSPSEGYLHAGEITARVPAQALGFVVNTPSLHVVDLGTEFGILVDRYGTSELHVFQGAVSAKPVSWLDSQLSMQLKAGEAIVVDRRGEGISEMFADRSKFSSPPSPPLSRPRPQLLGFYPLDGDVQDHSGQGNDGMVVSPLKFAEGHEGLAASFTGRPDSYIDLPIDASAQGCPDLTWGAWVRLRVQPRHHFQILSADNDTFYRTLTIDNRQGQLATPAYRFAMFGGQSCAVLPMPEPLPQPQVWTFIAGVYRQAEQVAALYVEDPALNQGRGGLASKIFGGASFGLGIDLVRVGGHVIEDEPFEGEIDNVFIVRGALGYKELENIRTGGARAILQLGQGETASNRNPVLPSSD